MCILKIRVMLIDVYGTLIKELNIINITLKFILSTLQKYKKCYFYFKSSFYFYFFNHCSRTPVNTALKKKRCNKWAMKERVGE